MEKYALITGAASGIGYQMALALHRRGYTIFGVSIEADAWGMKPLEEQIGLIPIILDITDIEGIKAAVVEVTKITGGKLDILYNNAGISNIGGPAIEYDDLKLQLLFNVNVLGHMYMTKYFSDLVINAKGTIVFTSSVAARVPLSWVSAYCATKAAIDQYAFVLRGEMKPFGVKVHSVITGGVNTAICDPYGSPCLLSDKYDVEGVYDSIRASSGMSRNPRTSIPASKYAEQVAGQITKKRDVGFNIYRGFAAYTLHWVRWYLPVWLVELGVQIHFKQWAVLRRIAKKVKRQNSAKLK
ncbi:CIC11C00000003565 [Sungouiella intermedia]|uniref:CIC11C00000000172 n=1 Tax=Sungouiella intermedia TaxID=45354 RepID=A0A1L0CUE5_9ASCO|nr:CIC11C00000003565 [[Candida] intermedia]SGZ50393.1 CIC11C00000000172 [[Candida] intermedia]